MSPIQKYGATPANIQWSVVRGDTGTLKIEVREQERHRRRVTGQGLYAHAHDLRLQLEVRPRLRPVHGARQVPERRELAAQEVQVLGLVH